MNMQALQPETAQDSRAARALYACPRCRGTLDVAGGEMICPRDGYRAGLVDGIRDFMSPEELSRHEVFLDEYRAIRSSEGRGSDDPADYLELPFVRQDHPKSGEWRMRAESMAWLREHLARVGPAPRTLLDAGAGNCWLTRRMAEWGHEAVALDMNVDAHDGLAAGRHYLEHLPLHFDRVRADFEHLPFADEVFDAVVFNGAFHYSQDMRASLAEAARTVRAGGAIIIIDSPIYADYASGMKMVAERAKPGRAAFLTYNGLRLMSAALDLGLRVDVPNPGIVARLKKRATEIRMGREIATMGRVVLSLR